MQALGNQPEDGSACSLSSISNKKKWKIIIKNRGNALLHFAHPIAVLEYLTEKSQDPCIWSLPFSSSSDRLVLPLPVLSDWGLISITAPFFSILGTSVAQMAPSSDSLRMPVAKSKWEEAWASAMTLSYTNLACSWCVSGGQPVMAQVSWASATNWRDPVGVLCSWFQTGSALAIADWISNKWKITLFLSLSPLSSRWK